MNHTKGLDFSPTGVRSKLHFGLVSALQLLTLLAAGSDLVATEASASRTFADFPASIRDPFVISHLSHALVTLWPQLNENGKLKEINQENYEELVDFAINKMKASAEEGTSGLRNILLWHLTSCYADQKGTNGLLGIDGIYAVTKSIVCPSGRSITCVSEALSSSQGRNKSDPLRPADKSLAEAALRFLGQDAAARVTSSDIGTGADAQLIQSISLEDANLRPEDLVSEKLFVEGVHSQLELQKAFRRIQWAHFFGFYKVASSFRHAQRVFFHPPSRNVASAGLGLQQDNLPVGELMLLFKCSSEYACFGIGGIGFKDVIRECMKSTGTPEATTVLHQAFLGSNMQAEDSLSAQLFATALLALESVIGDTQLNSVEAEALLKMAESGDGQANLLQQLTAKSVLKCQPHAKQSLNTHLRALPVGSAMQSSPALLASIAMENAPLFFSMNALAAPLKLEEEYQQLREAGASLGIALLRSASEIIATACGVDRSCGRPSKAYMACATQSLGSVLWSDQKSLLNQHLPALIYFAEQPDVLPSEPRLPEALKLFKSAVLRLADIFRAQLADSKGALDVPMFLNGNVFSFEASLKALLVGLDKHMLPMSFNLFEDGRLSLYGPVLEKKIASALSTSCSSAPPATGRGALKTFVIMQRLSRHFEELLGNARLQKVYQITSKNAGLSTRAVESTFVHTSARKIFVGIQSILESPAGMQSTRLSSNEELLSYITEVMRAKVALQSPEEKVAPAQQNVAGEIQTLATSVHKEVLRIFAKHLVTTEGLAKAFGNDFGRLIKEWLNKTFNDFRRDIFSSYLLDAAFGCFRHCVGPALRDATLKTRCTDSKGRPQPLIKCADPSHEFNFVVRSSPWGDLLQSWLQKGGAPPACQHLLRLLEEDENARWQQLYLMSNQLDKINCGKDHHGKDSYGRYSIKIRMVENLYDIYSNSNTEATMQGFFEWLLSLKDPLSHGLQKPISEITSMAAQNRHTQVRVGKAFKMAVNGDPDFSQCKPEETMIISELIPSLGNLFYTLGDLSEFLSPPAAEVAMVPTNVADAYVATARPALKPMMVRYEMTQEGLPDVALTSPAYLPLVTDTFLAFGQHATDVLAYVSSVINSDAPSTKADSRTVKHLLEATQDAEEWVAGGLRRCDKSCTSRKEGPQEVFVSIPDKRPEPYTFPATKEELMSARVFGWELPSLPPLGCEPLVSEEAAATPLPQLPPTMPETQLVPNPLEEGPLGPDIPQPADTEEVPQLVLEPTPPLIPVKDIQLAKKEDEITEDAEGLIVVSPDAEEGAPIVDPNEDDCLTISRLYYQHIDNSKLKDVDTLHEEAMAVPLYRKTRQELRIEDNDLSMQKFRLALCVTCAKHIPRLVVAVGLEKERLTTSLDMSKEACDSVYRNTGWVKELEGGVPLSSATPNSPFTKSMQLNLSTAAISNRLTGGVQGLLYKAEKNTAQAIEICATAEVLGKSLQDAKAILLKAKPETRSPFLLALSRLNKTAAKTMPFYKQCLKTAAELTSIFGASSSVGTVTFPPTSISEGLRNWLPQEQGLLLWAEGAKMKLKRDASVAALCAALRYAELIRQVTQPGFIFDRMLAQWNITLPLNSLALVNALRSVAKPTDVLTQELCIVAPPSLQVQQLLTRFDNEQWAALTLQTKVTKETFPEASPRATEA